MESEARQIFLSNRLLHLILMPTEECNLRCAYCYEDFSVGQMSQAVIEAIKALLARRIKSIEVLSLEWFGGEPLVAVSVIEEIQCFARELVRRHSQVRLLGSITTNGSLLNRRRFDRLIELGIRKYQISLDGTRESHDSTRPRLGGGGSFDSIWRNLLAIKDCPSDFEVLLRLHVTSDNQASIEDLLAALASGLGRDHRFRIMFKAVRRFGGPNDAVLPVLLPDEETRVLSQLFARAAELGLNKQEDALARPGVLPGCYAASVGSYVIRATGELAKCTVALGHANNRIGFLRSDGTVDVDAAKLIGWLRGVFTGQAESLECPMQGWADATSGKEPTASRLVQIGAYPPSGESQPKKGSKTQA